MSIFSGLGSNIKKAFGRGEEKPRLGSFFDEDSESLEPAQLESGYEGIEAVEPPEGLLLPEASKEAEDESRLRGQYPWRDFSKEPRPEPTAPEYEESPPGPFGFGGIPGFTPPPVEPAEEAAYEEYGEEFRRPFMGADDEADDEAEPLGGRAEDVFGPGDAGYQQTPPSEDPSGWDPFSGGFPGGGGDPFRGRPPGSRPPGRGEPFEQDPASSTWGERMKGAWESKYRPGSEARGQYKTQRDREARRRRMQELAEEAAMGAAEAGFLPPQTDPVTGVPLRGSKGEYQYGWPKTGGKMAHRTVRRPRMDFNELTGKMEPAKYATGPMAGHIIYENVREPFLYGARPVSSLELQLGTLGAQAKVYQMQEAVDLLKPKSKKRKVAGAVVGIGEGLVRTGVAGTVGAAGMVAAGTQPRRGARPAVPVNVQVMGSDFYAGSGAIRSMTAPRPTLHAGTPLTSLRLPPGIPSMQVQTLPSGMASGKPASSERSFKRMRLF